MASFFCFIFGLAALFVMVALIWRFSSLRSSLPCPAWLSWMVELDNPVFRNNSAKSILQHLNLAAGMHVLDYGCGPGRLTLPAARQVGPEGRVTAFDIQSEMLERVREKAKAEHLDNIHYIQGAAGEGKLQVNAYDRILLVTVLGEIPDQQAAMVEIFRALKPGGILSVTEVIADPHFQRCQNVRKVATSAGFSEKNFFGMRIAFTMHFEKPASESDII